ncbi:GntR family transcriptional regulator [Nocardia xishanensis]
MTVPNYLVIANEYAQLIETGALTPGTRLPSYVELAAQHGVSQIVIREAVRNLRSRGLIRSVPRRGTYVTRQDERLDDIPGQPPSAGIDDDLSRLASVSDPIQRARIAGELVTAYQLRIAELGTIRQTAIEEAHQRGLAFAEIADMLGLSRGRISQLRSRAPHTPRE